jgi:hypothetical protein
LINLNLNLLFGSYYGTALIGRQYSGASTAAGAQASAGALEPPSGQVQAIGDEGCGEIYDIGDDGGVVRAIKPAAGAPALAGTVPEEGGTTPDGAREAAGAREAEAKRVEDRFQSRLEDRLRKPGQDQASASRLAESLKTAAEDIGGAMGQAKANQFMNKVLSATAAEASEDSVGLAVESFFSQLAATSKESPAAYQRLAEIKKNLNRSSNLGLGEGLEAEAAGELEAEPPSPAKERLSRRFSAGRPEGSTPDAARALGNLVNSFI